MYPIISNCNFEDRDDKIGKAVHAATKLARLNRTIAAESGLTSALDDLEETLGIYADRDDAESVRRCVSAEVDVAAAFYRSVELVEDAAAPPAP